MSSTQLQALCELGQQQLMQMDYLPAESSLVQAEKLALDERDFETLARLYMPLQECRRQRRQRCGEGIVRLDLVSTGPGDHIEARHIVENYPHGQLLVAGWGSIEAAAKVRSLAAEHQLYVETFLAAVYPIGDARAIAIIPTAEVKLPAPEPRSIDELIKLLPAHSVVVAESEVMQGDRRGNTQTYAHVMSMWERLHAPFLATADSIGDPMRKIEAYRATIRVDYACELAHQKLSEVAQQLARSTGSAV